MWWYLTEALTCISLITNEIEYIFPAFYFPFNEMSVQVICISSICLIIFSYWFMSSLCILVMNPSLEYKLKILWLYFSLILWRSDEQKFLISAFWNLLNFPFMFCILYDIFKKFFPTLDDTDSLLNFPIKILKHWPIYNKSSQQVKDWEERP